MKIKSGARAAGSNQTIEVELEDSDMQDVPNWDSHTAVQKFQIMTKRADSLVVEYMFRNGFISKEFAQQRMAEIGHGPTS